jgi:hypothetical protein
MEKRNVLDYFQSNKRVTKLYFLANKLVTTLVINLVYFLANN